MPPSSLTRRYRFLHENIALPRQTLTAFVEAGLVREYDPVDALASLGSVLGKRANDNRRREALTWAFRVWRTAAAGIRHALRSADLQVPTVGGWQPANGTAFSESWTSVGVTLENYLVDASQASPDCRRSQNVLLVGFASWPDVRGATKRQWIDFLTLLGVADGLIPVVGRLQDEGHGWRWDQLRRNGKAEEGLGLDWCSEAAQVSFNHPNTPYTRQEEAWRLPGQIEYDRLSAAAKQSFHELAFRHLTDRNAECLSFDVGRFERQPRYRDAQTLPTPLAAFLRSTAWIAVDTREESRFHRPGDCWAARSRNGRPPRFIPRLRDAEAALVETTQELADLVFGDQIGVGEWDADGTAVARLRTLAAVVDALATHDRRDFHVEYRRAWNHVADLDAVWPPDLDLAVSREGRLEILAGDETVPPTVIVAPNAQAFDARILSSAGHALLDVGTASVTKITDRIAATKRFVPRRLDGVGVRLLVDGKPFVPTTGDPLLTSLGLGWLPEVVLLGHELRAEGLERGVRRATVERRIRAIRVRRCQSIALVVDDKGVSPAGDMAWYGVEHDELPTLILADRLPLTRASLGWDLSRTVSRLVDTRLRFIEPLLQHLTRGHAAGSLDPPTDQALTDALGCDAHTLGECRAALRMDLAHVLHLLAPVVAYFADIPLARKLARDAEHAGPAFDVTQWFHLRSLIVGPAPAELVAMCVRSADRAALRRELDLDYGEFNRVLLSLDEPPLSNETELRSVYQGYLGHMRPAILDRLRHHYAPDYQCGRDLADYVTKKTLEFLPFDCDWILSRETLDLASVSAHVARLLDGALGAHTAADLPPSRGLVERNRKTMHDSAAEGAPAVAAWCRHNEVQLPVLWRSDDAQGVARHVEDAGLLDFEVIATCQVPGLCQRAACWPAGMPLTINPALLEIDQAAVSREEERRKHERTLRLVEERSIEFAGTKLDTGDAGFAEAFRQLAEEGIAGDPAWFDRSKRQPRLADLAGLPGGSSRGGAGRGSGRRRPTDSQRGAMGLASEWLAFQYLKRRHSDSITEDCWISTNRARFFGGGDGDDAAGYDFRVQTPTAEWLYEVKSAIDDTSEFELTPNEMRVAAGASKDGRRRYRVLYVPFVFSPERWFVLELPNPMGDDTRSRFRQVGQGSVRFRFEHSVRGRRA